MVRRSYPRSQNGRVSHNTIFVPIRLAILDGNYSATEEVIDGYHFVAASYKPAPSLWTRITTFMRTPQEQSSGLEIVVGNDKIRITRSIRDYLGLIPMDSVLLITYANHMFHIWECNEWDRYFKLINHSSDNEDISVTDALT